MTFQGFVSLAEQLLTLIALVGAAWSAWVFVQGVAERNSRIRQENLSTWRKASLHRLLHTSKVFLTADEILQQLRSASFDTDFDVKRSELTVTIVRLLLLEMLESGVIKQLWGDRFGIQHYDPEMENQELIASRERIVREVFRLVCMAPGNFTTASIQQQFPKEVGVIDSDLRLVLGEMVKRGVVKQLSDGKWSPATFRESDPLGSSKEPA